MQRNATNQARPGLTPRQERAILELLSRSTIEEAAKAAGVNKTTLWRWFQLEEFHTAYMKARRESVKQAFARLQRATSEAVNTLSDVMKSATSYPAARVSAAKAILEFALKAVELEDLAERVNELEQLMKK